MIVHSGFNTNKQKQMFMKFIQLEVSQKKDENSRLHCYTYETQECVGTCTCTLALTFLHTCVLWFQGGCYVFVDLKVSMMWSFSVCVFALVFSKNIDVWEAQICKSWSHTVIKQDFHLWLKWSICGSCVVCLEYKYLFLHVETWKALKNLSESGKSVWVSVHELISVFHVQYTYWPLQVSLPAFSLYLHQFILHRLMKCATVSLI